MPSAIVRTDDSATGCPACSDATIDAAPSACTPTTRVPGRGVRQRRGGAADEAAAADRHDDDLEPSGASSAISRPDRRLAGDDVGVVERRHEHCAPLVRTPAGGEDCVVDGVAGEHDLGAIGDAWPPTFGSGALVGM